MQKNDPAFLKKYAYAIAWAFFILFACGAPTNTLVELHLKDLFGYDKPIHMFLFGMQAWLIIKARTTFEQGFVLMKIVLGACALSALYGILIEVAQKYWFTGRSFDYFDMLADILGCVVVYAWFLKKRKRFAQ